MFYREKKEYNKIILRKEENNRGWWSRKNEIIDWRARECRERWILICRFKRTPMFEWIISCRSSTVFLLPRARASRSIPPPPHSLSLHWPSINYSNNFHARLPTAHERPLFGLRGLVASLESSLLINVGADNSTIILIPKNQVYFSRRRIANSIDLWRERRVEWYSSKK